MPVITFNAFSFLQKKLKKNHIEYSNVSMIVDEGTRTVDLLKKINLKPEDIEVVFINGKVASIDTIIEDNDRVALIPPGTPGPYRALLGFKNKKILEHDKNIAGT